MSNNIFDPTHYAPGHVLKMVPGGEPYFTRLLALIDAAKKLLHFQVYIFENDDTGREVAAALKRARLRGVDIFLVMDSYGSKSLPAAFIADLRAHGIHVKYFSPLPTHFFMLRLGRRLHNKVVVADHSLALLGGINIADKYRGTKGTPWLDFAVDVQGPVCIEITRICERIYREKYFGKIPAKGVVSVPPPSGAMRCRFVLNDWFRRKNQVGDGYRAAFREAQQSITIVASYFLPNRNLRSALKKAVKRNVQVTVLLPGQSDLPMAKRATRYLYQWLMRNNIRIFEWEDSILHGKLAVVDNQWATIGSYNLNHLSQYSSIEMNIEVLDTAFATSVQQHLNGLTEQSTAVTTESFRLVHGVLNKFLDWASYTLARWIMKALFFLVRREHQYKEKE